VQQTNFSQKEVSHSMIPTFALRFVSAFVLTYLCLAMLSADRVAAQSQLSTAIRFSRANMKLNNVTLNGTFDFRFKLFDAPTGGTQIGPILTITNLNVSNGSLPAQSLDFGPDAFTGEARWVEVRARQGTAAFAPVGLRNKIFAVPYALALPGLRTQQNEVCPNIIGGFAGNTVAEGVVGATISGGGAGGFDANTVDNDFATIGGGIGNAVSGTHSTVGGGISNFASGVRSTIGGGSLNLASGSHSTVAGGNINSASGLRSSIGGGFSNDASGESSTIGGGQNNTASGLNSTAVGGLANVAAGAFSFAAGRRAKAGFDGSFVWADSTNTDFGAGAPNSFNLRASGGVFIFSDTTTSAGVFLAPGSGSWANVSDRAVKANIQPVDARDALNKVLALPICTWNYTSQDESIRHIGPMAQDFHAAFGVGESDKHITTIDADGVLFAAIQGLHQSHVEKDIEIAKLREELAALTMQLRDLRAALETLTQFQHSSNPTGRTSAP
jgi:hypothetical protein